MVDTEYSESELRERAAEQFEEQTEEKIDALEKIGADDALEHEVAQLGELEIEIRTYIPGRIRQRVQSSMERLQNADEEDIDEVIDNIVPLFDEVCTSDTYDEEFWRAYADEYGEVGLSIAMKKILAPAIENTEEQAAAIESFRPERNGHNGAHNGNDGGNGS